MGRSKRWRTWGAAFWLAILLLAGTVQAQQPPVPPTPETLPPAAATADDRTIYVPFKDLSQTFGKADARLVIPYVEYKRLLDQARAAQNGRIGPDAVLSESSYIVQADETVAKIAATFKVEVLTEGARLPLRFSEAAIGAVVAPEGVLLRGTGPGTYELFFPKTGSQLIKIDLAARVHQSPAGREILLSCPAVAVTKLDVTVPQADQTIDIDPQVVAVPVKGMDGITRLQANVGATEKIAIRWHAASSQAPSMNLLASVVNQTLVTIAEGQVHTHAWLTYDVLRGEVNQLRIALPASMRLLDVNSETRIRNWKSQTDGDNQIVTIDLLNPATKQLKLELDAETKLEDGPFQLGGVTNDGKALGIQPLDAVRVSGQLAVRHGEDLSLQTSGQQGLVRIDASEAAPQLAGSNALLFKFYTADFALQITVAPVQPRLSATQQIQIVVREDELEFTSTLRYLVERAGVFELNIRLPENVKIDDVSSPQMKSFNVQAGLLTVLLRERTQGDLAVAIKGRLTLPKANGEDLPLPILKPEGVDRDVGTVLVFARESVEVQTPAAAVQSAQPLPISQRGRIGDAVLASAWTFTRQPVVIPIRLVKKPARLTATVATTIDVQPEVAHLKSQVSFLVELSPLNTFRIEVPEAISSQLQIEPAAGDAASSPIRQKIASDPANGRVVWTITTQRDVLGTQRFTLTWDARSPAAAGAKSDAAAVAKYGVELPRPLGLVDDAGAVTIPLSNLQGEVALLKDKTLSVSATSSGSLEQIDSRELTLLPQTAAVAWRYFRDDAEHPAKLDIEARRFEIQNVVSTIVSRALVEIVTSRDPQATYRCQFHVQTTERQRLLVALPNHLEVLGVFINDRELKLEKADVKLPSGMDLFSPFWLNIARAESSDIPLLLTFQFLWNIQPPLGDSRFGSGDMVLPLPVIDAAGNGVVQELKVVIWVPQAYTLVGNPKPFEMATLPGACEVLCGRRPDRNTEHLAGWVKNGLTGPSAVSQFPTDGRQPFVYTTLGQATQIEVRWWNKLGMAVLFSLAAAIIGWILLSTTFENKIGVLLLFAFLSALYGLYDSASLHQAMLAARFGLVLLVALWIVHWLLKRPEIRTPPAPPPVEPAPVVVVEPVVPPQPESGSDSAN